MAVIDFGLDWRTFRANKESYQYRIEYKKLVFRKFVRIDDGITGNFEEISYEKIKQILLKNSIKIKHDMYGLPIVCGNCLYNWNDKEDRDNYDYITESRIATEFTLICPSCGQELQLSIDNKFKITLSIK